MEVGKCGCLSSLNTYFQFVICTFEPVPLLLFHFYCFSAMLVRSLGLVSLWLALACACPGCGLAFEVHSYGTNVSCLLLVGRGWEHNVQNDEIIT